MLYILVSLLCLFKKCIFCNCWVEFSININYAKFVVLISCIITDIYLIVLLVLSVTVSRVWEPLTIPVGFLALLRSRIAVSFLVNDFLIIIKSTLVVNNIITI